MSINCCICKKKQSGGIIDYALSPSLNEQRVCTKCWEMLQRIKNAKSFEDVPDDVNDIKAAIENNQLEQKVKDFLLLYLEGICSNGIDNSDIIFKIQVTELISLELLEK